MSARPRSHGPIALRRAHTPVRTNKASPADTLTWQVTDATNQLVASGAGTSYTFTPGDGGLYTVTFTVSDPTNQRSAAATARLSVTDVAPTLNAPAAPQSFTEGANATVTLGTFTDPGAGPYSLTVAWVHHSLTERCAGYRYALEHLTVAEPQPVAAEAERILNELQQRIAGNQIVALPRVAELAGPIISK